MNSIAIAGAQTGMFLEMLISERIRKAAAEK